MHKSNTSTARGSGKSHKSSHTCCLASKCNSKMLSLITLGWDTAKTMCTCRSTFPELIGSRMSFSPPTDNKIRPGLILEPVAYVIASSDCSEREQRNWQIIKSKEYPSPRRSTIQHNTRLLIEIANPSNCWSTPSSYFAWLKIAFEQIVEFGALGVQ